MSHRFITVLTYFLILLFISQVLMLTLAWKLHADQMGFFTINEWQTGMSDLG